MEKNKDAVKKPCMDCYDSKKLGIAKPNIFKNNAHLYGRSDRGKKLSYISRSKNASNSVDKKSGFYSNDAKAYLKQPCDKCEVKSGSHVVVNTIGKEKIDSSNSDLNGALAFNAHQALCNFACSVPDISSFNKVLNYSPNQQNEIPLPRYTKHKQNIVFPDQRTFNSKASSKSNISYGNKVSAAVAANNKCHCSKNTHKKSTDAESNLKMCTDPTVSEHAINDKFNSKCNAKYASPDASLFNNNAGLVDLPVLEHSDLVKDSCTAYKVECCSDERLPIIKKQRKQSRKWDRVSPTSSSTLSSKSLDETDKMLFPALPSNNHSEQVKLSSSCTDSMPPSEHSSAENSDLENAQSLLNANVSFNAVSQVSCISSIPQASYADVIRMSAPSTGIQGFLPLDYDKTSSEQSFITHTLANSVQDRLQKDEIVQPGSSDWVISRLSQLDQNSSDSVNNISLTHTSQNGQNFVAPRPIVVSLEKPSFYNSSLQTNKNVLTTLPSHTHIPSSDRKIVENDSLILDCLCTLEKISMDKFPVLPGPAHDSSISELTTSVTHVQDASVKTDSVYSSQSSISSFSDAFKQAESRDLTVDNISKSEDPPVIIMNNCSPPENMSEISFGIEYEEMVKLCADSYEPKVITGPAIKNAKVVCPSEKNKIDNTDMKSVKAHELTENNSIAVSKSDIEGAEKSIIVKGKKLCWKDFDVGSKSNHMQLAEYFASVWDDIEKSSKK
ncbi:hypothetical protein X975_00857, partial [Stegodyphus mimosarum]